MVKKAILLFCAALSLGSVAKAQWCITDEKYNEAKAHNPQIAQFEQQLNQEMVRLKLIKAKTNADLDTAILHIPVVVHIVHDYGTVNYVEDNRVFEMIDKINIVYAAQNTDLADVIAPFKPYIGNGRIRFHLATKDPLGRPTIGITHRYSYLTNGGDDQAKFDLWPPDHYLNIWVIDKIGRGTAGGTVLAYATPPASGAANPYEDGVLAGAPYITDDKKTVAHEIGHFFNLAHPWGNTNDAGAVCGDDEVDDTPPTKGHFGGCNLYDTTCTNVSNNAARVMLDTANGKPIRISTENNLGIDFIARTGVTIDSVSIYPTSRGAIFDIALMKYNSSTNNYTIIQQLSTNSIAHLGKPAIDMSTAVAGTHTTEDRAALYMDVNRPLRIESVDIYPTTLNDSFRIILYNNTDTVASYRGVTTTTTGAQTVPVGFFVAPGLITSKPPTKYRLAIARNPGLLHDLAPSIATADSVIKGNVRITKASDTVTGSSEKNRYNYIYNWQVRYKGVTASDTGAQDVPLGFVATADSGFRLAVIQNPGLKTDSITVPLYTMNIPCVFTIKDDTTKGRYNFIYNWRIRSGYIKDCIDYPDTTNTQNIMDYSDCPKNFTKLQVERMRAALRSSVADRKNLITEQAHITTGIYDAQTGKYGLKLDLPPVPDFSVERTGAAVLSGSHYMCANTVDFTFRNRSWGDTITGINFEFANGNPATATTANANVKTKITQPGWVTIKLTATGNHTGNSAIERTPVYAADPNYKIDPIAGYYQEFGDDNENSKWPIFNYFSNDFKWQVSKNTGYYDRSCIVYSAFDNRTGPAAIVGAPSSATPDGTVFTDEDDFFTPAFDLSAMQTGNCNLNYMYSGAYRVNNPDLMKDKLEIAYSTDCGANWKVMTTRDKEGIANKGSYPNGYAPLWMGDWKLASINIPADARKERVFFRFRYKPTGDPGFLITQGGYQVQNFGVGNNYYMDRINISNFPLGINTIVDENKKVAIAPNPTTGSSYVVIQNTEKTTAQVQVTDITGKVIYRTEAPLVNSIERIEIPASVISVKGIYLVHIITGSQRFTEKLVSQ